MALAVPLSRFTSRVGGGSAFFVRHQDSFEIMRVGLAYLICDRGEGHPERDTRGRKADRAQGLGHRLRNSQAQTLPLSQFSYDVFDA